MVTKTKKTKMQKNIVVEIPLPDGWVSMYVGRLVKRTKDSITLVDAAWVSSMGRRSAFFAGRFDSNCEIEPYPNGVKMELPAMGAVITEWKHSLLRDPR